MPFTVVDEKTVQRNVNYRITSSCHLSKKKRKVRYPLALKAQRKIYRLETISLSLKSEQLTGVIHLLAMWIVFLGINCGYSCYNLKAPPPPPPTFPNV
jgi:hypothetical protein